MQKDADMMDNQFDRFDSGNDELNELLSSDKIDSEEREELIKAFTATLIDNPLGDGKAEDYHSLFTTIQINYVDRKITELRSATTPTQADDEKALGYCSRLRELINLFASEGKDLPPIKNTRPEEYESEIKKRHEKEAELNTLVENDTKINNLLIQAQKYPDEDICNEILSNLEVLKTQISSCKEQGFSIPQLRCNNSKEIAKVVNKLKSFANKRDNLYRLMLETDDKISELNSCGNYNKQNLKLIKSLCEQQNNNIQQCLSNGYPIPELNNKNPSDSISQHKHYVNMVEIDSKITTDLLNANTIIQYKKTIENCDKQVENIEVCLNKNWAIPALANNDIQQVKETVQSKIKIKEKKYKVRLVIISVAALAILVVTLIIVFTVKSHEGKSAFPYDSAYAKGQNVESVQKGLSDAGFTNIVLDKDESGWAKEGTVLGISDAYDKGTYYNSDSEIHIKYSCEGRIEVSDLLNDWQSRKYTDVISSLKSAGFNNISKTKTGILNDSQKDITAGLELNGIDYHNGECYIPTSAPIKVSYYVYQISIGNDSEEFLGKDYKTVESTLKESGFSNVRTEEISSGWAKEGSVTKLTVNGEENYKSNNTYDPDAQIVVQYSSGGRTNATSCFNDWQNTNYSKVKANLDKAGFTNVKMTERITDVPSNDELISTIKINNSTFNGGECYIQKDAPIYIDYYVCKLKIGIPSSEIKDKNYKDLSEELKQKGFSNITIKRADDMYHGFIGFGDWFGSWGTTEGNVKEFSIGGKTEFSKDDLFDFDNEIIIIVHTYEGEGNEDITLKD